VAIFTPAERLGQIDGHGGKAVRKRVISDQMAEIVLDCLDETAEVLAVPDWDADRCSQRIAGR
jgi:hypothetical protein